MDPTGESGVWRLGEPEHAWLERVTPAEAFDRTGITRVDPLRLVAREQDELWLEVQLLDSIEESFGILSVSKESLQSFGRNDDGLRRRHSYCRDGPGHQRLTMLSYFEPGQSLSQRVVGAAFGLALRHEIAVLQQLRPVFLQEPLDRSGARFVWSRVDVADALCHHLALSVIPNEGEGDQIC